MLNCGNWRYINESWKYLDEIALKHISTELLMEKILMEKQLFLARLENTLGKGTSWEDEDDDF